MWEAATRSRRSLAVVLAGLTALVAIPSAAARMDGAADTRPPSVPLSFRVSDMTGSTITVVWSASSDDVGVVGYRLYRSGALVGTTAQLRYTFSGLSCKTWQLLGVEARDQAGNTSPRMALLTSTAPCSSLPNPPVPPTPPPPLPRMDGAADTRPPSVPLSFRASSVTGSTITATWSASSDDVAVVGYRLYRHGALVGTTTELRYTFTGLTCKTWQLLGVEARDAAGKTSPRMALLTSTAPCSALPAPPVRPSPPPPSPPPAPPPAPPIQPTPPSGPTDAPLAPKSLVVEAVSARTAVIRWTTDRPATSQVEYGTAVTYGLRTSRSTGLSMTHAVTLTNLSHATQYHFRAVATDGRGTVALSADRSFTTQPLTSTARKVGVGSSRILLDGEPYFPIMQWLQCSWLFTPNVHLGVNTFMGKGCGDPDATELNNVAQRNALSIIPFASAARGHKALLGWHLPDEPDWTGLRPASVKARYDANRSLDTDHVTFLTLTSRFFSRLSPVGWMGGNRSYYFDYAAAADVVGFDLYPVTGWCRPDWISWVADAQRELAETYAVGKPTYQWIETAPHSSSYCRGRGITPPEVRAQVWMAIANGAKAIGYFTHSWQPSYSQFRVAADVQAELKRTNRQVTNFASAILAPPAELAKRELNGGRVDAIARRFKGATYVFAVNVTRNPVMVRFGSAAASAKRVEVFEEGRSVAADAQGAFTDTFAPLEVHVYVIAD